MYTLNTYVFRAHHRAVLCLLLAGVTAAVAAPSFRADKNYPDLGLRLRVLGNAEPEPLAQYKTYTYTYTRGDEQFKKDKFSPLELLEDLLQHQHHFLNSSKKNHTSVLNLKECSEL